MLNRLRVEPRESNNDEIVLLAEEGEIRVTAKIPCSLIDRLSAIPLTTFRERLDLISRNLAALGAVIQSKFSAGQFRAYHGADGRDRWIVVERRDLAGWRLR